MLYIQMIYSNDTNCYFLSSCICLCFKIETDGQTNDHMAWWRHQMETFSALLAICAGHSPVPGECPTQRPVTRSFDVYFDLRPNKRLSKQSLGWWFETLSPPLWRHRNGQTPLTETTYFVRRRLLYTRYKTHTITLQWLMRVGYLIWVMNAVENIMISPPVSVH